MSMWQRVSMRRVEFGLLLLGALIMAVTVVNLELSQGNELSSSVLWVIGGYFGVFSIAHLALCFLAPYADQLMLPVAALLNGLGLIMINRLDVARGTSMAPKQVMWALVAIVLMIVVLLVVRDYRTLSRYSFLLGLVGLVLLALPMVWPSGTNADAKLWISIGPFSLQPGEFSKILLLLFFAQLLVNKRALFQVAGARFLGLVPRFGSDFGRVGSGTAHHGRRKRLRSRIAAVQHSVGHVVPGHGPLIVADHRYCAGGHWWVWRVPNFRQNSVPCP